MRTEKLQLMEDIYDHLMKNDYPNLTNICEEFSNSWIDCEKGIIYLHGSKSLPNMRLEIYKD
jgi:hypothetical protein